MKIKAAVLREYGEPVSVEQIELAPPKEKEVLIKTAYTGFCHSDLSFIDGVVQFPLPLVLGHEAAGVVEEVGPGVTSIEKGDHVVAAWMVPCGECPECTSGQGHICRESHEIHGAGTLLDKTSRLTDSKGATLNHQTFISGFAEYMVIPEKGAIRIRDDMPLDQACFLGCCLPTGFGAVYNAANVKPGDSVAVWGMGGVGLNVVHGASIRHANPVIGIDLEGGKESIAREFGATHFIDSSREDPVPAVQLLTGGEKTDDGTIMGGGADYCFEVIGDPGAITQAYWALGFSGKLVQVGIIPEGSMAELPLTFHPLHCKSVEGTLYGNIEPHYDIPAFAEMAMKGYLMLDRLISKKFKIEDINDVAETMRKRQIVGRWVCEWD
ncbi:alcohol dehydrogenase catalytic domain-containing protein [Thermodesulfobacteriota bacterium]